MRYALGLGRKARASGSLPRRRGRDARSRREGAAGGGGSGARAHVLSRPRRPAGARRRRRAPGPSRARTCATETASRCSPVTPSSRRHSGSRSRTTIRPSPASWPTRRSAMIGGQHRDIVGDDHDLAEVERLKTGRLFSASVGLALNAVGVPVGEQAPWRAFGDELGPLFQVVDDILDEDGFAARLGVREARRLADDAAERARERLGALSADTSVLLRARRGSRCSNHLRVDARPDTATIRRSRTGQVRAQPHFFARGPSFPPHRCPSAFTDLLPALALVALAIVPVSGDGLDLRRTMPSASSAAAGDAWRRTSDSDGAT